MSMPRPELVPSDPMQPDQWYLQAVAGSVRPDLNVTGAWRDVSGAGVKVGIYDDGVERTHPDLDGNYDTSLHITFGGQTWDGAPTTADSNHGTAVAGIIAAENNGTGTVGVAWGADIGCVNIFAMSTTQLFSAMGHLKYFDVTNHSWGWNPPFVDSATSPLWSSFFSGLWDSVNEGRGGLGTVNVVAAGNDRPAQDETGTSDFTSSRFVISVGAVADDGAVSWYSNPGASLFITAPSNGGVQGIVTTDRQGAAGYTPTDYTAGFGGTSAATPMVSGVVALMLEANPLLGWRDVQEILALSARHVGSDFGSHADSEKYDWQWNAAAYLNGGGFHMSGDFGFGLVDATAAVRLAQGWTAPAHTSANEVLAQSTLNGSWTVPATATFDTTIQLSLSGAVQIETLTLELGDLSHTWPGDIMIDVTSPLGTVSRIIGATGSSQDISEGWAFLSHAFRGETAEGVWQVRIQDVYAADGGSFSSVSLKAWGAPQGSDDSYYYNNEFAAYGTGARALLSDSDGGTDTLNMAMVSADIRMNFASNGRTLFLGQGLTIATGTQIENAVAGDGNDIISGTGGDNLINGMAGNDWIMSSAGADTLLGGAGNDRLDGGGGNDVLKGGEGTDSLYGGLGADDLDGGAGFDTASYVKDTFAVTIDLTAGTGRGGTAEGDRLVNIEAVASGAGADRLVGSAGNNLLSGGAGNDVLIGNGGNDRLQGQTGNDTLTGGTGSDTFIFDNVQTGGVDTITDFTSGTDRLFFAAGWSNGAVSTPSDVQFLLDGTVPQTAHPTFLYDQHTGILSFDADGSGTLQAQQVAVLDSRPALLQTDFMLG